MDMKNVMNVIKDKFKQIYFNSLFRYLNGFTRNYRVSLILIMVNYFQQLSLTTFSYLLQFQNNQDIFWRILSEFLGYFSLQVGIFKDKLIYAGILAGGFYLVLFALILLRGMFFEINAKKSQFTLFEIFISFILKMQYVLYQPFATLYCLIILGKGCYYFDDSNVQGINNSTLNMIFSLGGFFFQFIFKMMASYHDIEIRFRFDDYLSRPITYFFVQQSILETILTIVFATKTPIALYIFQIILGGLTILEYYRSHVFLQSNINKLYVTLQYSNILINLLLVLEMGFLTPNIVGALILFIFTLSSKLNEGIDYFKRSSVFIQINPAGELEFDEVEYFIRQIWNYSNFSIDEYLSNWKGVHFESLKQSHLERCSKQNCFCQKQIKKENSGDSEQENSWREKFFKLNVLHIFQLFLKSKNRLSQPKNETDYNILRFSYLAYMIDVLENPLISLPYITKLNRLKFNPREQIILFLLQQQVNVRFSKVVYRNEKDDWSQVIYFDTTLEVLQTKIYESLQKLKQIVSYIGLDYFSLQDLKDKIDDLLKIQQQIEQISIKLYNYNQHNRKLQELIAIYLNQFDFRRKQFRSNLFHAQKATTKEIKQDFLLMVTNSCIIFSSLLKPLGIIKSYTSNTKTILE